MHLMLIEDEQEKLAAQQTLKKCLVRAMDLLGRRRIGYPGGNQTLPLYASDDFWFANKDSKNKRWNAFGFLHDAPQQFITVEINVPKGSNTRRIAGFFAKNLETGRVYVLHSGDVGGGGKGIGKREFLAWSTYEPKHVSTSDGKTREGILIARIDGRDVVSRLRAFAQKVRDFKIDAKTGHLRNRRFRDQVKRVARYTKEFSGRKSGNRNASFDYVTYHGDVVEALNSEAKKLGFKTHNSPEDLVLRRGRRVTKIYEVKPSTDSQALYAGIGQLLVYSARYAKRGGRIARVLVIPEDGLPMRAQFAACLKAIGINTRYFGLSPKGVVKLH